MSEIQVDIGKKQERDHKASSHATPYIESSTE